MCWLVAFSGLCLESVIVVSVTVDKCLFCQFQFEAGRSRTGRLIRIWCRGLSQETASVRAECAYRRQFVCLFVWPSNSYLLFFFFHGYTQTRRVLSISSYQCVSEGKPHLVLVVVSFITAVFWGFLGYRRSLRRPWCCSAELQTVRRCGSTHEDVWLLWFLSRGG